MASVLDLNDDPPPEVSEPMQHSFDLNQPAGEMTEEGEHQTETQEGQATSSHHQPRKSKLSTQQRIHILMKLHQIPTERGRLMRGQMQEVANQFIEPK